MTRISGKKHPFGAWPSSLPQVRQAEAPLSRRPRPRRQSRGATLSRGGQDRNHRLMGRHQGIRSRNPRQSLGRPSFTPVRPQRCRLRGERDADGKHRCGRHRHSSTMHTSVLPSIKFDAADWTAESPSRRHAVGWTAGNPSRRHAVGWTAGNPSWRHAAGWMAGNPSRRHAVGWMAGNPSRQHAVGWMAGNPSRRHVVDWMAGNPSRRHAVGWTAGNPSRRHAVGWTAGSPSMQKRNLPLRSRQSKRLDLPS
jgi:hypothetical protein